MCLLMAGDSRFVALTCTVFHCFSIVYMSVANLYITHLGSRTEGVRVQPSIEGKTCLCGRPTGRITRRARSSVRPSVPYGLVTRKQ